jgi:hypothetical protein
MRATLGEPNSTPLASPSVSPTRADPGTWVMPSSSPVPIPSTSPDTSTPRSGLTLDPLVSPPSPLSVVRSGLAEAMATLAPETLVQVILDRVTTTRAVVTMITVEVATMVVVMEMEMETDRLRRRARLLLRLAAVLLNLTARSAGPSVVLPPTRGWSRGPSKPLSHD